MGQNFWVSPRDGRWGVRGEGNERDSKQFDTQREAQDYAIGRARGENGEVIVQRPDGRIRSKDSYGNDPCPPKDSEH